MSHTHILRAGLSCFKRIPSTSVLNGVNKTTWNRLMYPRQLGLFSLNHSANYSNERGQDQIWARSDGIKRERSKKFNEGRLFVPEPRVVTSVPTLPKLKGNESFIAIDVISLPTAEGNGMVPFFISAASSNDSIQTICKPQVEMFESVTEFTGMVFDKASDQVLKSGQPVETVETIEALTLFLDFVKRHENPVLLTYSHQATRKLEYFYKDLNLFDELKSAVSFKIDTFKMIKKKLTGPLSLAKVSRNILNMNIPTGDNKARCEANLKLFTQYIQPTEEVELFLNSLDETWAKNTYLEMVHNDKMNFIVSLKLARAGVGLDHLKFLHEKGFPQFEAHLLELKIFRKDIDELFKVVSNMF